MNGSFTIVPTGDFALIGNAIVARARRTGPNVIVHGESVQIYFAGATTVARTRKTHGLACLRIVTTSGVIQIEPEGYEGSLPQLLGFVRWILDAFAPCRVYDDETGEDLTARADHGALDLFTDSWLPRR